MNLFDKLMLQRFFVEDAKRMDCENLTWFVWVMYGHRTFERLVDGSCLFIDRSQFSHFVDVQTKNEVQIFPTSF